jgi:hypothetical protein
MQFRDDNRPAFSYYDAFNGDLRYAERSSRGKWSHITVASNNTQGLYSDLQFTFDTNQPAIAYWNKTSNSAMLAFRTPGGGWTIQNQLANAGRNITAVDGLDHGGGPDLILIGTDTTNGGLFVRTV